MLTGLQRHDVVRELTRHTGDALGDADSEVVRAGAEIVEQDAITGREALRRPAACGIGERDVERAHEASAGVADAHVERRRGLERDRDGAAVRRAVDERTRVRSRGHDELDRASGRHGRDRERAVRVRRRVALERRDERAARVQVRDSHGRARDRRRRLRVQHLAVDACADFEHDVMRLFAGDGQQREYARGRIAGSEHVQEVAVAPHTGELVCAGRGVGPRVETRPASNDRVVLDEHEACGDGLTAVVRDASAHDARGGHDELGGEARRVVPGVADGLAAGLRELAREVPRCIEAVDDEGALGVGEPRADRTERLFVEQLDAHAAERLAVLVLRPSRRALWARTSRSTGIGDWSSTAEFSPSCATEHDTNGLGC